MLRVVRESQVAFIYWVVDPDFLVIVDSFSPLRPTMTVTNAIEEVLGIIDREVEMPQRVIYRDSLGDWSEVLLDGERRFAGFAEITRVPFIVRQLIRACDGKVAA